MFLEFAFLNYSSTDIAFVDAAALVHWRRIEEMSNFLDLQLIVMLQMNQLEDRFLWPFESVSRMILCQYGGEKVSTAPPNSLNK